MELKRIDTFLLKTLYLVEAGIVVGQVLNFDSLTSLLFVATFPITVLLWIRMIRKTVAESDMIMIMTVITAVVCVLLNAALANASLGWSYIKKLIMFIMTLLFFQTAYRARSDEKIGEFIGRIVDLLTVFLILMYFLQRNQMHTVNGIYTVYLTFRFTNPNTTALFLASLYMLKMHRLFGHGKWYVKAAHGLGLLALAWFVAETQSRNCLLVLVLYTVIVLWLIFRGRKDLRVTKGWAVLFAVFPGLMVIGYMLLINSQWVQNTFSFIVGEGKGLDSRVNIWGPALENLWSSPVFGAYYEISNGTGTSQMHNSHMDIAASYGIVVLVLVCILLTKYLHQRGRIYTNKSEYIYILSFACMITMGMGEAAVFSGGLGIYIFAGASLLLANRKDMRDGPGQ